MGQHIGWKQRPDLRLQVFINGCIVHTHTLLQFWNRICVPYASLKASTLVSILVVGQWPMVSTLVGSTDQTNDCSCDKRLHTHTLLHFYGWILWNGICVPYASLRTSTLISTLVLSTDQTRLQSAGAMISWCCLNNFLMLPHWILDTVAMMLWCCQTDFLMLRWFLHAILMTWRCLHDGELELQEVVLSTDTRHHL